MAGIDTPAGYSRLERTSIGPDADVYRAWDERAGRWAVLRLFHRFVGGRSEEAAFAAHIAASVGLGRNPSIVGVRAGGITATGRPWLALDAVDGRLLADVLNTDPPAPAEALQLVIVLADTLAWAHAMRPPMVHGRIRAESVLIAASGTPMLTDFSVPSPPGATAPTPRDDVTSLAALLFRALTGGSWPGRGEPDDRMIAVWPGLTQLFDEVLTPAPAVDTMAVFAARLRQVRRSTGMTIPVPAAISQQPAPAVPQRQEQTPAAYGRKRRVLSALAALLIIALVGFGARHLLGDDPVREARPAPVAVVTSSRVAPCPPATPIRGAAAPSLWWPADEGTGRTVCDRSGSGNPATLGAGAGWSSTGDSMRFAAGAPDSHASGSGPAVRTDRSFTVMAWVNLSDTGTSQGILSQPGTVSSGFSLNYDKPADSWRMTMPRSDTRAPVVDGPSSTSKPKTGTWTHLAATYDAENGEITIYVDGVAEETAKHTVSWNAGQPVQVARSWSDGAWSDRFDGLIDDVRAYRLELPPAEITAIVRSSRADHPTD